MDDRNFAHLENAHERAVAALNDAIMATQSTGLGKMPPSLAADLTLLQTVRDRVDGRLLLLRKHAYSQPTAAA